MQDDRFLQLFKGSGLSHGALVAIGEGKYSARTVTGPASPDDYRLHLEGMTGLGLVPIREDGTCRFAAIDVDVDTINHQQLLEKVTQLKMPLSVCRSKSGGAHLYLFMADPGLKASVAVVSLKRWAGMLGYPTAEIFPKQTTINAANLGNWLNLPYFGSDSTTRYAVGPHGAYTLAEFLDSVKFWDGKDEVTTPTGQFNVLNQTQMPPCLASLTKDGLPDGSRNQGLFNFAVFFRKSSPNGWEELLMQHNQNFVHPPLPLSEVQAIIKSAGKTRYQYKCNEEPICSRCERTICLTVPFGVGHMPWKEAGNFDDLRFNHLRKILTDPPHYLLEINGRDLPLDSEQLFDWRQLKKRVEEVFDLIPKNMPQEKWDQQRRELHQTQELIDAPADASVEGQIMTDVNDFMSQYRNSKDSEDLLKGMSLQDQKFIYFQISDLQRFLKLHRRTYVDSNMLFRILYQQGCKFKDLKVKGKEMKLWMYPLAKLNVQTEDYTAAKFETVGDDL